MRVICPFSVLFSGIRPQITTNVKSHHANKLIYVSLCGLALITPSQTASNFMFKMPHHARLHMCLSIEDHESRVLDVSKHYFGCLRDTERQHFYNRLPEESQRRIRRKAHRIAQLRAKLECQPETKAGTLLKVFKETISDWRGVHGWASVEDKSALRLPIDLDNRADSEIKASMIFFKDSRPYNIPGVENAFPNQKIPIKKLLADEPDANPLMKPCDDNMVRYFHLPANNMIWVEVGLALTYSMVLTGLTSNIQEVMARYYHERRPDAEDLYLKSKLGRMRTKTEMLLAPEFWQGQQDFDDKSEVHARHMRPLCDVISTSKPMWYISLMERLTQFADPISTEPLPKNLVLFVSRPVLFCLHAGLHQLGCELANETKMPYLHWETDRGRVQSAAAIKEASIVKFSIAEVVNQAKAANEQSSDANRNSRTQSVTRQSRSTGRPMSSATGPQKRKLLGEVLLQAAALMEAIDCRIEESLIFEYLHKKPPLHPRRTLDQSHYVGLKDTASRDRDQVVYRATVQGDHDCEDNIDINNPWKKCKQCQEDSRKVPLLIMVDQLWLWILDESKSRSLLLMNFPGLPGVVQSETYCRLICFTGTVLTCFPRRFGKIRPDSSAVHKSLRMRLKMGRQDEIRSAYDLALIIIDECSRVFFDRTKIADRQPNLVDMFAAAIRHIVSSAYGDFTL
jgi:hypothetical protein